MKNDENLDIRGTFLQGEFTCDYKILKKCFGKHGVGDKYKIDASWNLRFPCGTIATIYNYKDGKNYCGREGLPKTKITNWHVGGHNKQSFELVLKYIKENWGL